MYEELIISQKFLQGAKFFFDEAADSCPEEAARTVIEV
jgi:hypothetical protein